MPQGKASETGPSKVRSFTTLTASLLANVMSAVIEFPRRKALLDCSRQLGDEILKDIGVDRADLFDS